MKEWIDRAPGIFAIGTASVLLVTVLHELGYFLIVGYQFQSFLSVSDYFANSILWLPYFALFFFVGVAWSEFTRPSSGGMTAPSLKIFVGIIVVSAVAALIMDYLVGVAILAAIIVIAFIIRLLKRNKDAGGTVPNWAIYLGMTVPIIGSLAFLNGVANGRDDLKANGPHSSLHLKAEDVDEAVVILRTFDRGVLAMSPTKQQIEFFRWEEIQKISTLVPIEKTILDRWPVCMYYGTCK